MSAPNQQLLSRAELAKKLNRGIRAIDKMIEQGRLMPSIRIGNRVYFSADTVIPDKRRKKEVCND